MRHFLAGASIQGPALPKYQPLAERSWGWRTFALDLNGTLFREPLGDRHFLLCRWSPDTAMEGHQLPAGNWAPFISKAAETEARQPACSHPTYPSPKWADSPKCRPLLSSSWPNWLISFRARTRLSSSTAASLLERKPTASCLSRSSMPDPDSLDCCKGLASCSAARPAQERGQRRPTLGEGQGSQLERHSLAWGLG